LIDVPKEISDRGFNTAKVIAFVATADLSVIAFASLVVVSDRTTFTREIILATRLTTKYVSQD
jgi:hypothetical protein